MPKCLNGIFQMLQNIQHENKRETLTGLEALVERTEVNPRAMRAGIADQVPGRLDSFHLSELGQLVKEQAVTAAHVQYSSPTLGRLACAKHFQNEHFPGAPPPVPPVQLTIESRVIRTHK
jgi:hypothetical protein